MGETVLDTRRRAAQRGPDIEGGVNKATGQNQKEPVRRNNDTQQLPTSVVVKAAKESETVGSSGERQFGTPPANTVRARDNNVKKLEDAQNTDNVNSSTDKP